MTESRPRLANPDGRILPEFERKLFVAKKVAPVWAKHLIVDTNVQTLEGEMVGRMGDMLCRGGQSEVWPQANKTFMDKYEPTDEFDNDFQKFRPKPDIAPVEACAVDEPFAVQNLRGLMKGKAGDYLVRSTSDPADIWIVAKTCFLKEYMRI